MVDEIPGMLWRYRILTGITVLPSGSEHVTPCYTKRLSCQLNCSPPYTAFISPKVRPSQSDGQSSASPDATGIQVN